MSPGSSNLPLERHVLAVDVGNSTVKAGLFESGRLVWSLRSPTDQPSGLTDRLTSKLSGVQLTPLVAVIGTVVKQQLQQIKQAVSAAGIEHQIVLGSEHPVPIVNLTQRPEQVGQDRLLAGLGASQVTRPPLVVIDAGTAITVDLVDADGRFVGGSIFPGLRMMARALHDYTDGLPQVEVAHGVSLIGTDTGSAIRAGIFAAAFGGVDRMCRQLSAHAGRSEPLPIVATGGDSIVITDQLGADSVHLRPDLVLEGIWHAYAGTPIGN